MFKATQGNLNVPHFIALQMRWQTELYSYPKPFYADIYMHIVYKLVHRNLRILSRIF